LEFHFEQNLKIHQDDTWRFEKSIFLSIGTHQLFFEFRRRLVAESERPEKGVDQ